MFLLNNGALIQHQNLWQSNCRKKVLWKAQCLTPNFTLWTPLLDQNFRSNNRSTANRASYLTLNYKFFWWYQLHITNDFIKNGPTRASFLFVNCKAFLQQWLQTNIQYKHFCIWDKLCLLSWFILAVLISWLYKTYGLPSSPSNDCQHNIHWVMLCRLAKVEVSLQYWRI